MVVIALPSFLYSLTFFVLYTHFFESLTAHRSAKRRSTRKVPIAVVVGVLQ